MEVAKFTAQILCCYVSNESILDCGVYENLIWKIILWNNTMTLQLKAIVSHIHTHTTIPGFESRDLR